MRITIIILLVAFAVGQAMLSDRIIPEDKYGTATADQIQSAGQSTNSQTVSPEAFRSLTNREANLQREIKQDEYRVQQGSGPGTAAAERKQKGAMSELSRLNEHKSKVGAAQVRVKQAWIRKKEVQPRVVRQPSKVPARSPSTEQPVERDEKDRIMNEQKKAERRGKRIAKKEAEKRTSAAKKEAERRKKATKQMEEKKIKIEETKIKIKAKQATARAQLPVRPHFPVAAPAPIMQHYPPPQAGGAPLPVRPHFPVVPHTPVVSGRRLSRAGRSLQPVRQKASAAPRAPLAARPLLKARAPQGFRHQVPHAPRSPVVPHPLLRASATQDRRQAFVRHSNLIQFESAGQHSGSPLKHWPEHFHQSTNDEQAQKAQIRNAVGAQKGSGENAATDKKHKYVVAGVKEHDSKVLAAKDRVAEVKRKRREEKRESQIAAERRRKAATRRAVLQRSERHAKALDHNVAASIRRNADQIRNIRKRVDHLRTSPTPAPFPAAPRPYPVPGTAAYPVPATAAYRPSAPVPLTGAAARLDRKEKCEKRRARTARRERRTKKKREEAKRRKKSIKKMKKEAKKSEKEGEEG